MLTFLLLFIGHETTANTLSTLCYNLCKYEDIQERVHEEIEEAKEKHGGKITYESLEDLKYLEATLNENLRLNGPVGFHLRTCTKDCEVSCFYTSFWTMNI